MVEESLERRILREIRERLNQSRAAVDEYQRLEIALQALGETAPAASSPARRDRRSSAAANKRAPRGANREKALQVIADRPGVTVAELAEATGIAKSVLYSLTRTLTEKGDAERVNPPGGGVGFRIPEPADPVGSGADDGSTAQPAASAKPRRARRRRAKTSEREGAVPATPSEGEGSTEAPSTNAGP